jgi:hypothetical protein
MCMVNDYCHSKPKAREPQIEIKELERSNSKDASLDSGWGNYEI